MIRGFQTAAEVTEQHTLRLMYRTGLTLALRRMKPGPVVVSIEPLERRRTASQNAYLHAVPFPILAEHFGCSVEELKYDLMGACWGWHFSELAGREVPVRPSTSSMSVDECKHFIDWLLSWAKLNHDIDLPLPGEVLV